MIRGDTKISTPFVVGAIVELGRCMDLTTSDSIEFLRIAHNSLLSESEKSGRALPINNADGLRRNLDCAVVQRVHEIIQDAGEEPIQCVKGVFTEGVPIYATAGFLEKTHLQVAVRDPNCIKGVFRVAPRLIHSYRKQFQVSSSTKIDGTQ